MSHTVGGSGEKSAAVLYCRVTIPDCDRFRDLARLTVSILTNKIFKIMKYISTFTVDGAICTREDSKLSDLFASIQMFVDLGFVVAHLHFKQIKVATA